MLRRRRARHTPVVSRSNIGSDSDNEDEDDIFGAKKQQAEEKALVERRRRIAKSAVQHSEPTEQTTKTEPRSGNHDAASNAGKRRPTAPKASHLLSTSASTNTRKRPRVADQPQDEPIFDMFARGAVAPAASAHSGGAATGVDAPVEVEGYARVRPGETLRNGRYVVSAELGRGVFASVVRATERTTGRQVAIKLSRANAAMRRAALRELSTLRAVAGVGASAEAACVVQVLDDFMHRDAHVAIVFELLAHTLRDIVKLHVQGVRLAAVRVYAAQLLRALAHLARADVVHADVKPDNVLLAADRATLRLADFGCALRKEHRANTPPNAYLAARYYRAPESVLGLPPTPAVDTWAAACVLFELYTGSVCFPAPSNNSLLCAIVDARGNIPARMCRRAPLRDAHFDADGRLLQREVDPITGAESVTPRLRRTTQSSSIVRDAIMRASAGDDQGIAAPLFADLIEAMLTVDPAKRIAPSDAVRHPFFKDVPNA